MKNHYEVIYKAQGNSQQVKTGVNANSESEARHIILSTHQNVVIISVCQK